MDNRVDRTQRPVKQSNNAGKTQERKLPRPTVITAENRLLNLRDQRNPISAGPAYTPLTRLAKFKAIRDRNLKRAGASTVNLVKAQSQSNSNQPMASERNARTSTHQVSVVKVAAHLSNGSAEGDDAAVIVEINGNSNGNSHSSNGNADVAESQENGSSPAYQNGGDHSGTAATEIDESEMPVLTQEAPYLSQHSSSPSISSSLRNSSVSDFFAVSEMSTLDREIGESEEEQYDDDVQLVIEEEGSIEIEPTPLSDLQGRESDAEEGGNESSTENDIDTGRDTSRAPSESSSEHLDFAGFPQTSAESDGVAGPSAAGSSKSSPLAPSAHATYSRVQVRQSYRTGLKRKAEDDGGGSTNKMSRDGSQRSPGWRFLSPGSALFWRRKPDDTSPESEDNAEPTSSDGLTQDKPKPWLSYCQIM